MWRAAIACLLLLLSSVPAQSQGKSPVRYEAPHTYVMLSGIVGSAAGLERLSSRLRAAGHQVLVIDPYLLSIDSADVSFAALSRRVDRVLQASGIQTADVIGHGHGGGVALRLAATYPKRVSSLILLDVAALQVSKTKVFSSSIRLIPLLLHIPGGRSLVESRFLSGMRANMGHKEWFDKNAQRNYIAPILDTPGAIALARRLAVVPEPEPVQDVVSRIHVPVTVLLGDVPHPSAPGEAELKLLQPLGPLLHVQTVPGTGHFLHEELPDEVAARILRLNTSTAK